LCTSSSQSDLIVASPPAINDPRFVGLLAEVLGLFARRAVGRTLELTGPGRQITFVVDEIDLTPADSSAAEPSLPATARGEPQSLASWGTGLLRAALESAADPMGTAFAAMDASRNAFEAWAATAAWTMWPSDGAAPSLAVRLLDGGYARLADVRAADRAVSRLRWWFGPVLVELGEQPALTIQRCEFEAFLDEGALHSWLPSDALPAWAHLTIEDGRGAVVARRIPRLGGLVVEAEGVDGKAVVNIEALTVAGRRVPLPRTARRRITFDPSEWRAGLRINHVGVEDGRVVVEGELDEWTEVLRPSQLMEIRDRLVAALAGRGVTLPLLDRLGQP
jgi:hypothetical protein